MNILRYSFKYSYPLPQKGDIVDALERQAANQQVLDFGTPLSTKAKGKSRADGLRQTQISFFKLSDLSKPKKNQEQRLRELAVKHLGKNNFFHFLLRSTQPLSGPCIRVNIDFHRLVRRLHIIYFRETEYPTEVLLPALLSTFKKRNFTPVTHKRTGQVWVSRKEFLEYERALELDKLLDDIGEEQRESVSKRASKTPTPRRRESATTPLTPGSGRGFSTPLNTPKSNNNRQTAQPKSDWDRDTSIFENIDLDEEIIHTTREQKIKMYFDDRVYPRWQELVSIEDGGVRPRPIGLERFDAGESADGPANTLRFISYFIGHVYTRMVHKAIQIIAKLKDYHSELKVLEALLDQRFWCRGKRAKWHTRWAIVLGHLVTKEKDLAKKRDLQLRILEGIKAALLDDDTGIGMSHGETHER
jgi:Fanconi-associated nuclease 1